MSKEHFENQIRPLANFDTVSFIFHLILKVEDFWSIYDFLIRPTQCMPDTEIKLVSLTANLKFLEGVKPMWEDENNKQGGRW